MIRFKIPALAELTDQQVRFAPPARRQEQLARAEKLLAEVDPEKQYPYQFVCFRVTDYRPESYADLVIPGADLNHDLRLLIESLSVPAEVVAEPIVTLDEISKQLNVSTKTIRRWRDCGLIGRRVIRNGRQQLAYPKSVVDRFVAANQARVQRGSRFSQLTEIEREDILRQAKRMTHMSNGSLTEISRRIARRLGRSPETVRYTIKNFDRQHPADALFPTSSGPVPEEAKQSMFSLYRRGIGVESLSQQFRRNRGVIYRAIYEMQARQLLSQASEPVPHASFDDPEAAAAILAPMPDAEAYEAQREMKAPKDVPPELAPLYEVPLLNKEQEQHLFRQMNFLKHKAWKLREQIDPKHARAEDLERFRDLHRQAQQVKERLINCNMRLVVSVAKRHAQPHENFFELLSDGNMSLIRAVDKFDFSRGNKFSTYGTWAIMKNFARSIPGERHHRERYVTGHEEMFEATADKRSSEHEQLAHQEQTANRVNHLLEALEPRLRQIIRMRAGLDNSEGMTLEEIGQQLGITKERVRQLNVRAMNQLRSMARDQRVDVP